MATLIVRHKVADYNNWKKVFDEDAGNRRSHGAIGHEILRDASDPNLITIVNKMKTLDGARNFASSPALKEAMNRAGIVNAPEVSFLNDEESANY